MMADKAQAPASIQRAAHVRRIHRAVIDVPDEAFWGPHGQPARGSVDELVSVRLAPGGMNFAHKTAAIQHGFGEEAAHGDVNIETRTPVENHSETDLCPAVDGLFNQRPRQLAAHGYVEIVPDECQSVVIQIVHDGNEYKAM